MNKRMKVAIVTGASRGIGRSITTLLCMKGYHVIANYHLSETEMQKYCTRLKRSDLSVEAFRADVTKREEVQNMVKYGVSCYGKIDLLVNNAGISQSHLFQDIRESDWDRMIDVNLKGVFNCSQAVVPFMLNEKRGKIINISSIWGIVGASCEVHYSAAKAGIIGFTKALSKELAPSNIQVNCVAPGVIRTSMLDGYTDQELNDLVESIPTMRIGRPSDVARSVGYLAIDAGNYLTGQVISPNGGLVL